MGKITLDNIQPGMILGDDVSERSGRILLKAGAEVSEKHLNVFRSWGVMEVDIEGVDSQAPENDQLGPISLEQLQAIEEKARELFRHTDQEHAVIGELFRLYVHRHAARAGRSAR